MNGTETQLADLECVIQELSDRVQALTAAVDELSDEIQWWNNQMRERNAPPRCRSFRQAIADIDRFLIIWRNPNKPYCLVERREHIAQLTELWADVLRGWLD